MIYAITMPTGQSTALLLFLPGQRGAKCRYFIPDRRNDGYGMNLPGSKQLATTVRS